jgi:hypothetical protein
MGCNLCLATSTPTKMTNWKIKSPWMTLLIMKKTTLPMMKMLMKMSQLMQCDLVGCNEEQQIRNG